MSLLEFNVDRQFLQAHTMSFKLPADDVKTYHLRVDRMLEFEDEFYYIADVTEERIRNEIYKVVKANALWYRLGERKYIGQFQASAVWPALGLDLIVAAMTAQGLTWKVGNVSASATLYSLDVTDASWLDMLYTWGKICQCEIVFDTKLKLIHFAEELGGNFNLSFRYSRNLTEISRKEVAPSVTRLYPYGRTDISIADAHGGVEYLEDFSYYTNQGLTIAEARAQYTKDYSFQDDSFVDAGSLLAAATTQMATLAQPQLTYKAKVVDLSRITGYEESAFGLGDYVQVEDEPLGISVFARVIRYVRYPYEPFRNEVELAFAPITLPDPGIQQGRQNNTNWELFSAHNKDTIREVSIARTVLHRLPLVVTEQGEWIMTYSLRGICTSSGTLQITFWNDYDDTLVMPTIEKTLVAGQPLDYTFSLSDLEVPTKTYQIVIRAEMIGGSGRFVIQPDDSQFWVFARNVTAGQNPAFSNSIRFDCTGSPVLWRVPDDVDEIEVEAHGCVGNYQHPSHTTPVGGCKIVFKMQVIAGDYYQVKAGCQPYPNAGESFGASGDHTVGGGATDFRKQGASDTDVIVMAAGSGSGATYFGDTSWGGYGGFVAGGPGYFNGVPGPTGGTQTEGGIGTGGGDNGSFQNGGDSHWDGNFFHGIGGCGGGGWYGGGAGYNADFGGGIGGYGGGGGSSHVADYVYDLEYQDGENEGAGYLIIRWPTPVVPGL